MTKEELKNYLPHREPMLLVDEINIDENHVAHSKYHVTGEEFFLKGHFPGQPTVPGVILCEIMAQSCALLMLDDLKGKITLYTGIDNVRFKYQVRPGDTIVIRSTITDRRQSIIFVKAEAKVDGKLCCRGNLSFALV